ncbi:hypothetical protein HDR58_01090 [bacterium]|nr:hypothetical protein [bacterium]
MNEPIFNDSTTAEIEARLLRDVLIHENKIVNISLTVIIILIFLFRGWIGYWLKFGIAIPTKLAARPVITKEEPIQTDYTETESLQKTFTYTSLINKHRIKIIPVAHYELSGLTVAYNHDFFFVNDFFDSAALYDIGTSWGDIGEKKVYNKYFKSYSEKTAITGTRILWTNYKTYPTPISIDYAKAHWSHSHLVPANRNIMAALLKIKKWDKVKIEGDLIDMEYQYKNGYKSYYRTSMGRNDTENDDRGNGTSETIYVTKVQIGNLIYQ